MMSTVQKQMSRDGDICGDRPCRSQHRSRGAGVIATQVDSDTDADDERLSSVPGDVVDALEADLATEQIGVPVEVFAMKDEAPNEFEDRSQMGRRVVLVHKVLTELPVPIMTLPVPRRRHSAQPATRTSP